MGEGDPPLARGRDGEVERAAEPGDMLTRDPGLGAGLGAVLGLKGTRGLGVGPLAVSLSTSEIQSGGVNL